MQETNEQPATTRNVRLTELAVFAGCTGKAGASALAALLAQFTGPDESSGRAEGDGNLLVGLHRPDDAAVYCLSPETAIVATVDFSAPMVDDPYAYGAIAAANALSDVYAMGATPVFALNIAAFPVDMDPEVPAAIVQGGRDKVAEAGAVIAGGHTIIDAEPKYGLSVIGVVHPDRMLTRGGARAGDRLYLTKPLGTGLISTAGKFEEAEEAHLRAAIESMARLNGRASSLAGTVPSSMTDVTGFGLLGHAREMADASGVCLEIEAGSLPLLPGALEYAYRGVLTGGGLRNREYFDDGVILDPAVSEDLAHVLFDPQTSGGLLIAVPSGQCPDFERRFEEAEEPLWRVGRAVPGGGVHVV